MLSNSSSGYISIVVGYPQSKLTGGINAQNISSKDWPDGEDSEPIPTFAVVPTQTCYLMGLIEDNNSFIQKSIKSHKNEVTLYNRIHRLSFTQNRLQK